MAAIETLENDSILTPSVLVNNSTLDNLRGQYNDTPDGRTDMQFQSYDWFQICVPIISSFGILGNLLNLVVLTRRRMVAGMDRLGRTANYGLVALAVSDLLFCVIVFPHTFITTARSTSIPLDMYYRLYGIAAINLFIMISTWLIVSMAVKRYIVVVYPLHAREHLTLKRSIVVIAVVYLASVLLTMPYFLHLKITASNIVEGAMVYKYKPVWSKSVSKLTQLYMRWVWPVIADFIPVVLLVFCNIRLIRELQGASAIRRSTCPGQRVSATNHRVTLTLVIIVLMLLVLVSPAEVLKYINPYKSWGYIGYIVASVANMLQTINFSTNFLLYFAVNAKFRQTVRTLLPNCFAVCFPNKKRLSHITSRTSRFETKTEEVEV